MQVEYETVNIVYKPGDTEEQKAKVEAYLQKDLTIQVLDEYLELLEQYLQKLSQHHPD